MRGRIALGLVGVLALSTMAACGDDDDSSDGGASTTVASSGTSVTTAGSATTTGDVEASEQEYVDALVKSFQSSDGSELHLTSDQAECVAPKWIRTIGVDRLHDKGVEPSDIGDDSSDTDLSDLGLSEAEGNAMYDAFGDCKVDVRALFVTSLSAGEEMSDDTKQCVDDAVTEDLLRELLVTSITKGDAGLSDKSGIGKQFNEALAACAPTTTT
jgi:hypothetical protein